MSYDPSLFSAQLPVETGADREFRQWAEELGTTFDTVRYAVTHVGHNADAVREFVASGR